MVSPAVGTLHCLHHSDVMSNSSPDNTTVDQVPVFAAWVHPGCLATIGLAVNCVGQVIRRSCGAQVFKSSRPLLLNFPTPFLPMIPYHVW